MCPSRVLQAALRGPHLPCLPFEAPARSMERPRGALEAPPREWLGALLEPSLLPKLLAAGWVPPLPRAQLEVALQRLPPAVAQLLLPPEPVLERCWSLPPLDPARRQQFQALWDGAAPG